MGLNWCPPDDNLSTWSLSKTQSEAKASHNVGVLMQVLGTLSSSDRWVRCKMFSAIAAFVTFAQASDNFPYKKVFS